MRRNCYVVLLTLVTVALTACGSRRDTPNPFDGSSGGGGPSGTLRIEVQNLNFNDVTVWAMRQGQRIRVGRVTGKTDESFQLAWNEAVPISFMIDVTGGRSCRTANISVDRDARVWVSVPANVGAQACRIGQR